MTISGIPRNSTCNTDQGSTARPTYITEKIAVYSGLMFWLKPCRWVTLRALGATPKMAPKCTQLKVHIVSLLHKPAPVAQCFDPLASSRSCRADGENFPQKNPRILVDWVDQYFSASLRARTGVHFHGAPWASIALRTDEKGMEKRYKHDERACIAMQTFPFDLLSYGSSLVAPQKERT